MKNPNDIANILRNWKYDEDDCVRLFIADNGKELMQIRRPLGIEQYNLDGRPDGLEPNGEATYLDVMLKKIELTERAGGDFIISHEDCLKLRKEGILFYFRYLALNQVGQYLRVARDTEHNLRISKFIEMYYEGEGKYEMLQYRPYMRSMNGIAKAMLSLGAEDSVGALQELGKARMEIEWMPLVPTSIFEFEKIRSVQHLEHVINQIREVGVKQGSPTGLKEKLFQELSNAVESENYELAANIRDRIKELGQ